MEIYRVKDEHEFWMLLLIHKNKAQLIFPNDGVYEGIDIFESTSKNKLYKHFNAFSTIKLLMNFRSDFTLSDKKLFLSQFEEVEEVICLD